MQCWPSGRTFDEKLAEMKRAHAAEIGETINTVEAINEATLRLQNRTVTIRTVHATQYRTSASGPEVFSPSRAAPTGTNGSSGGGTDAKALARAVADALEGTRVDVDGRQLGRLVTRHQPLAVAELGGRR